MQYTKLRRFESDIHVLEIPQARFHVTPFGLRTVSETAKTLNAPVVVNGGDHNAYGAVGLAASEGNQFGQQVEWEPWVNFTRSHIPQINAFDSLEPKFNALAGKRFLVYAGKRWPTNTSPWYERHPRTLVGVTLDAQCILMVVDGRTPQSRGINLFEAAETLLEFNAWHASDLDGGGSSAMWIGGRIVNIPIDGGIPGKERAVGTHIALWPEGELPPLPEDPPTGEIMNYIVGTTLVRLNVRDKPDGNVLRTLGVGTSVEADQVQAPWLHLTKVNDNPVTEEWWVHDGNGNYLDWKWVNEPIPDPDPEPPPASSLTPFDLNVEGFKPYHGELEPE